MILVTGATGLTGQFVVEELLRRGHAVRAFCRTPPARETGAEIALGDLADHESLVRAARGATAIVHPACTFTDREVDAAAMRVLLDAWGSGPFVYISSLDVYGWPTVPWITEATPLLGAAFNEYAHGKVVCERMIAAAGRTDYTSLRAPYIWGPHPTAKRRLVRQRILDGLPIVLPGVERAEWERYQDPWIDVRDLAGIVAACLERPAGGPLNVMADHVIWRELFAALIALTGSRSAIVGKPLDEITDDELPNKRLYASTWRFSGERLAQHLGAAARPRYELAVTLRDTVGC